MVENKRTEEILKKIYEDLMHIMLEDSESSFLKEYTIPSLNYNSYNENMFYYGGIEMELYKMMEQFENKIYFISYKDKYFFSNDKERANSRVLLEIQQEIENNENQRSNEKEKSKTVFKKNREDR